MPAIMPHQFRESVQRARAASQRGDLQLLGFEAQGFDWEEAGLQLVNDALLGLADIEREDVPSVLLFTGHMIDVQGREPRFPNTAGAEAHARRLIFDALLEERQHGPGRLVGISGGACGGDILFHEVCAELGIPTQLYLALPAALFVERSVAQGGARWRQRFELLMASLPCRVLNEREELPGWLKRKHDYSFWQRNNFWMMFNALALARDTMTLLALWDGGAGEGSGGTQDLVDRVAERGQRVRRLPAERLRQYADGSRQRGGSS